MRRIQVLGPSGAGKTTLLRLIAGLDDADSGLIKIDGQTASDPKARLAPHQRKLSMVFQDLALWPHMRAWENVAFMRMALS
jgi:ABC-type Fe3+/spermidine/putrescine transport system ATPase subunit